MLNFMIRVYRANPYRPHCDSRNGIHTFLCRFTGMSRPAPGARCPLSAGEECDFPKPPGMT